MVNSYTVNRGRKYLVDNSTSHFLWEVQSHIGVNASESWSHSQLLTGAWLHGFYKQAWLIRLLSLCDERFGWEGVPVLLCMGVHHAERELGMWPSVAMWTESPCKLICWERKKDNTDTPRKAKRRQSIVLGFLSSNAFSILHFCS